MTNGINTSFGTFQVNNAIGNLTNLVVQDGGRVGIGTTDPKAAVHVAGGDVYTSHPGAGVILKSPNGRRCKKLGITNAGALIASDMPCP